VPLVVKQRRPDGGSAEIDGQNKWLATVHRQI
jgi:hypothetical protein